MKRAWLYLALALGCVCCDVGFGCDEDDGYRRSCNYSQNGSLAAGNWQLEGHGYRTRCTDRRLEGSLHISSSRFVEVEAMAESTVFIPLGPDGGPRAEGDAFVDRIARADYQLSASELPDDTMLEGHTSGSCLTFTVTEELDDGDVITYSFDGSFDGAHTIRGTFFGDGPEDCEAEGVFRVDIR